MSLDLVPAAGCAAAVAAICATGPAVIRRLPEPYAVLAARTGLTWRLAAAGAAVGAVVGLALGRVPALLPWAYLAGVAVVLAYIDAQTKLLPTRIIAPSYAVLGCLLALAALLDGSPQPLMRAGLGWLAMGGFYFVLWFVHPAGIGYGDVRLAGLLGLALGYLGWGQLVAALYAGFLLGGIGGGLLVLLRIVDHRRYPFGPFMVLGALVGVAFGGALGTWYAAR
jgi:leader peptidase (prepilin peptidase) / N-methyltransferase